MHRPCFFPNKFFKKYTILYTVCGGGAGKNRASTKLLYWDKVIRKLSQAVLPKESTGYLRGITCHAHKSPWDC